MMYTRSRKRKWVSPFSSSLSNSFLLFSVHFPLHLNCQSNCKRKKTHSEDPNSGASSSSTLPHGEGFEGGGEEREGNNHEVFLSFRGKDTRKGFTDYLYTSLVHAGIHVFRDDNELRVGEEIGPELLYSVTQSKISIPIISENYASSKWCLCELAEMLKCKRSKGQIVLPIFYKVEPSQIQHPTGRLRDAINAHKMNIGEMIGKEWEEALKEVGSLKGWESEKIDNGHEGTLVKIVVRKVIGELKRLFRLNVPEQLVGIDDHVEQIMSKMDDKFSCTRTIGIYGMGGIGKTTLAKVLYNKLSSHFEYRSFVANIREISQHEGIKCLQKQLIIDILGSLYDVSNVDEGVNVIKSRFTSKKVLALLDDMDDRTHLNALFGNDSWFGAGSVVIITTRNKSILNEARASYMYPLNELSLDQSLVLFSRHAFRKDSPLSAYEVISRDVVSTTGGLPLALEVMGSFLCGKREDVWKDTFRKLKKVPNKKVQEKLKISYEALDEEEQQIFLDIACFFIGSHKQNPTYMWDACDFFPGKGIDVLSLMSLIKIDDDGKLMMHDQLRDLGREIVRLENPKEPQERTRLWISEEAVDVLESNKGTRKIEALSLGESHGPKTYTAEQFKDMTNLRFLQADGAKFVGDFQSLLPKLRWLMWKHCPSKFVAANFHPKKLTVLNLSDSFISEDWEGWIPLKMATELKVLNLMGCQFLDRTPDWSAFKSLEILILYCCLNLKEIHPSVGDIKTLVSLDVRQCRKLKELPAGIGRMVELRELLIDWTEIQEIPISRGCMMKMETLIVARCRIGHLPESMGYLVSLTLLDLHGLEIEELPEFIGSMKELRTLDVKECALLARIPNSIGNLASLQRLLLSSCSSLTEVPDLIGKLASLTELDLTNTPITKLPESIGNLQNLRTLEVNGTGITELPDAIGMLAKLQILEASRCENLKQLPSNIGELVSLENLSLDESGISSLPESISKLSSLQVLSVGCCRNLGELPELPSGLTALTITCQRPPLPNLSQLTRLKELALCYCHWLECLPELPIGLSTLSIGYCGKLKASTNLSNLKHLSYLHLHDCFDLTEVTREEGSHYKSNLHAQQCPNASQLDGLLDQSNSKAASCMNSVEIQGLGGSKSPQMSDILKCTSAGQLLDFSNFKYLSSLSVTDCKNITEIQGLDELESLRHLDVKRCPSIRSLDLSNLKSLHSFNSEFCDNLVEITGRPLETFILSRCPGLVL